MNYFILGQHADNWITGCCKPLPVTQPANNHKGFLSAGNSLQEDKDVQWNKQLLLLASQETCNRISQLLFHLVNLQDNPRTDIAHFSHGHVAAIQNKSQQNINLFP